MSYIPIVVHGDSMYPIFPHNKKLLLNEQDKEFFVGEVVVFRQSEKLVIHRIIQIIGDRFVITKGDNNLYSDRPVRKKKILGKIVDTFNREDKYRISQYSRFVGIVCEKYGQEREVSCFIYILFRKYLENKAILTRFNPRKSK